MRNLKKLLLFFVSGGRFVSNSLVLKNQVAVGATSDSYLMMDIDQDAGTYDMNMISVGAGNNHLQARSYNHYKISGDFDVQVNFTLISYPNTQRWFAYIDMFDSWSPGVKPDQEIRTVINFDVSGTRRYGGEIRVDGLPALLEGTGGYSAATTDVTGKLRVVRIGTTGYCYYWNGTSWVQVYTHVIRTDDLYLMVWASSTLAGPNSEVIFDGLQINSGTIVII